MLKRRSFIQGMAAMALPLASSARALPTARIAMPARAAGPAVPHTIVSLSYETDNLREPRFFAAANTGLVDAFRRLNPHGVLRLGGNTSDLARPAGFDAPLPVLHPLYRNRERIQPYYDVTPAALDALAGFLDATGWKLIFGIDMRADSPELAAAYARMVRARLGSRLLAIQVGNEANNYFKTYAGYKAAWDRIAGPLGRTDIAGPDSGANTDWVQRFGHDVPESVLLSRHYYREAAERGSLGDILQHDGGFDREIATLARAARRHRHGFWLTETNSYYRGGRDGVSNAFASALWGLDFTLSAAFHGATGVCFQGGPRRSIESSLEGIDTGGRGAGGDGDGDIVARIEAAASNYSPIGGDLDTGFAPRPLYYGLLCAQLLAGGRFYELERADPLPGVRVYATAHGDGTRIVAINTSADTPRVLGFSGLPPRARVRAAPLRAPGLDARHALAFGADDRTLAPGTDWTLRFQDMPPVTRDGTLDFTLQAGSALLLHTS
jgi:hypothetical protein